MKLLVFDNYDSFTYNLVHLVEKILHQKVEVYRNDQITLEQVKDYDKIILSPGPGIPEEAGLLLPLIKEYAASKSILGVCLGQQAIGEAFGGKLTNLSKVYHGVATPCKVVKKMLNSLQG
ncbi:anthranilate synthase component II [Niabella hibiscisoli]|uniref:anthranilate synthase component II n=1 Tax=Niabella hibiscisoli TaxID=1825928 RepID=UPI00374DC29E